MKRILVVDDHTVLRQGVIRILEGMKEYHFVIDEAANEHETLKQCQQTDYDLILLDISLQGRNGLEILKQLKRLSPKAPVLVLSMHPAEHYAARAMRAGASGYITKDGASNELQTAVQKVLEGGKYLTDKVTSLLLDAFTDNSDREYPVEELLSDREFQIICMMASGNTMTEIGQRLNISVKTTSTYRTRILEKLNLRTTGEIIAYAVSRGLGSGFSGNGDNG